MIQNIADTVMHENLDCLSAVNVEADESKVCNERQRFNRSAHRKSLIISIFFYILMSVIAVILIFPYFYMIMKSLMTSEEVVSGIKFFPSVPQFGNYIKLFSSHNYFTATFNSLYVIGFNLIAIPLSASLIAFSFAKLKWKGQNLMFALMLSTMMLPAVATQIPLFVMYSKFKWIDTFMPLTFPNLFGGGAINIFLLRQFMMGIPRDMDNAAMIDGASTFRRYWNITIPLCKSVLVYIMVTVFIANWGDFYGPLVYMISSKAPKTLALVIFEDALEANAAMDKANLRMAGGVFMTIIPAILFGFFQKQLIEGIVMTGVKG